MHLHNMMDAARLEAGYPKTNTDWGKYIVEYTSDPSKCLFTSEYGFIAGYCTTEYLLMDGIRTGLEVAWYVDPSKRNQGVGMDLYYKLEDWASIKGCKYIILGRPVKDSIKVGTQYLKKLD